MFHLVSAERSLWSLVLQLQRLGARARRAAVRSSLLEGDIRLLEALVDRPLAQVELAGETGMDKAQVSRTVSRLLQKGLVQVIPPKTPSPSRGTVCLSDEGRSEASEAFRKQLSVIREFITGLKEHEIAKLATACRALINLTYESNLGPPYVRAGAPGEFGLVMHTFVETLAFPFYGASTDETEVLAAEAFLEYRRALEAKRGLFLVAESWGRLSGGILIVGDQSKGTARIKLLAVEKALLGHGIGTALLDCALNSMGKDGYTKFIAEEVRDREGTSYFEAAGWERVRQFSRSGSTTDWEEWTLDYASANPTS